MVLDALNAVWKIDRSTMHNKAIELLRARFEQPEPEPVAWTTDLDFDYDTEVIPAKIKGKIGTAEMDIPLYTAPQQKEKNT